MSVKPQLILHVGAPKCGSTALQNALSMTPDLVNSQGQRLRYTAWRQVGKVGTALYGRHVIQAAQASAYGYVSWPNFRPDEPAAAVFAGLDQVRRRGLARGHIPVVSCEGWISRAEAFAPHLARWGHPAVEVVAFLRPVVEWNNSAFWQWGIWNVPSLDSWLTRGNLRYSFGRDLEAWSKIPNVRVRFAWAQPDAVAQFAQWYGVDLEPALTRNTSSSPPLVGVLMRHRRLRPSGHDAATEFVVQRWCPPVEGRRLWAVMARHVHQLRPVTQENRNALRRIASDDAMRAVCDDPRWAEEKRHHAEILAGVSPLNDRAQLAELHASLAAGLARVASARAVPAPAVPPCPKAQAELADWDAVLVAMIDALLEADRKLRAKAWRQSGSKQLWPRATAAAARLRSHLFSRSR
jgi:hypothetical protein